MDKLVLTRFCWSPYGVYGSLTLPDGQVLFTVERPWLENKPMVSCIPEGTYSCRPRYYNKGGYEAVEILEVPGRSYILFHVANSPGDVKGCIGLGTDLGWVHGQWAVVSSKNAFAEFMKYYQGKEFKLKITHYKG